MVAARGHRHQVPVAELQKEPGGGSTKSHRQEMTQGGHGNPQIDGGRDGPMPTRKHRPSEPKERQGQAPRQTNPARGEKDCKQLTWKINNKGGKDPERRQKSRDRDFVPLRIEDNASAPSQAISKAAGVDQVLEARPPDEEGVQCTLSQARRSLTTQQIDSIYATKYLTGVEANGQTMEAEEPRCHELHGQNDRQEQTARQESDVQAPLAEYADVFEEPPAGHIPNHQVSHRIPTKPVFVPEYPRAATTYHWSNSKSSKSSCVT